VILFVGRTDFVPWGCPCCIWSLEQGQVLNLPVLRNRASGSNLADCPSVRTEIYYVRRLQKYLDLFLFFGSMADLMRKVGR